MKKDRRSATTAALIELAENVEVMISMLVEGHEKDGDTNGLTEDEFLRHICMSLIVPGTLRWIAGERPPVGQSPEEAAKSPTHFAAEIIHFGIVFAQTQRVVIEEQMRREIAGAMGKN